MRRSVDVVLACVVISMVCTGCGLSAKKNAPVEPVVTAADLNRSASQDWVVEPDPYSTYEEPDALTSSYESPELADDAVQQMGPRYHTVVKKDTLYALARMYYGDQRRWKDIYEANRSTISDPNKIRVGQRLLIP